LEALCRLSAERLDESRVAQFLHEHLPHCGCPAPAMRHPREAHAALMPLLALLRERGVISDLPSPTGPIADELSRYDAHMRDPWTERGHPCEPSAHRSAVVAHEVRRPPIEAPAAGIALWLGHESPTTTHHYVEADLAMKERALARLQEPDAAVRRYRAADSLMEFLKTL
jgi:hypothetical protein